MANCGHSMLELPLAAQQANFCPVAEQPWLCAMGVLSP
jgi:hypothetical protein